MDIFPYQNAVQAVSTLSLHIYQYLTNTIRHIVGFSLRLMTSFLYLDVTDIVELLLYFGCPLTTQNRFGETVLHIAAKESPQYVELLLQAGSSVNSRDNAGIKHHFLSCHLLFHKVTLLGVAFITKIILQIYHLLIQILFCEKKANFVVCSMIYG